MEAIRLALQGTLDVVSVADVLRLLAATAKTGQLRIENERSRGVVWVRAGRVTAVTDVEPRTSTSTVEFLFWFTVQGDGRFLFHVVDDVPEADEPVAVNELLAELSTLTREWDELHSVVPSLRHRVGLVASLPHPEVTIDASRWPAVLAAASEPTVQDLGTRFGYGDLDALRAVRDVVSTGVVEVRPPAARESNGVPTAPTVGSAGGPPPPPVGVVAATSGRP